MIKCFKLFILTSSISKQYSFPFTLFYSRGLLNWLKRVLLFSVREDHGCTSCAALAMYISIRVILSSLPNVKSQVVHSTSLTVFTQIFLTHVPPESKENFLFLVIFSCFLSRYQLWARVRSCESHLYLKITLFNMELTCYVNHLCCGGTRCSNNPLDVKESYLAPTECTQSGGVVLIWTSSAMKLSSVVSNRFLCVICTGCNYSLF